MLTDRQIFDHYFRPRDKHGVPKPIPDPKLYREVKDLDIMKQEFYAISNGFGKSTKEIDELWEAYLHGR